MPYPMAAPSTRTWLDNSRNMFEPSDLTGLVWWLDADNLSTLYQDSDATTPVAADGNEVGAWVDLVTRSAKATQATATKLPLYKTGVRNGKSGVLFDGSNDFLALPSTIELNGATTLLMVLTVVDNDAVGDPICLAKNTGNTYYLWIDLTTSGTGSIVVTVYDTATRAVSLAGDPTGPNIVGLTNVEGAVVNLWRDGIKTVGVVNTGTWGSGSGGSKLGIWKDGAALPYSGYIHELVIYNRVLTDAEMASLHAYLGRKWAIPTVLPVIGDPAGIAGGLMWFDATKLNAVADDRVVVIPDLSGNARHAIQNGITLQGLYKTGIQNGLPAVLLDGTNDYYSIAQPELGVTSQMTAFGVYVVVDHEPAEPPMLLTLVSNAQPYILELFYDCAGANDEYYPVTYAGGTSRDPRVAGALGAHIFGATFNTASGIVAYLDGATETEAFSAALTNPGYGSVYAKLGANIDGLSRWTNGYVCEVMVWGRELSPAEITTVKSYLAVKWGIAL